LTLRLVDANFNMLRKEEAWSLDLTYIRRKVMLPLSMAGAGGKHMISRVIGREDMRQHLADLGFVPGEQVEIISDTGEGNVIVSIKDTRLGITSQMASKIMVD